MHVEAADSVMRGSLTRRLSKAVAACVQAIRSAMVPKEEPGRDFIEQLESRRLLSTQPIITEFMTWAGHYDTSVPPNWQSDPNWIEIYNPNPTAGGINLAGYYLADQLADPSKWWQFPSWPVAALGYTSVTINTSDGVLGPKFNLDPSGEYLGLIAPDGQTIVSEYCADIPASIAEHLVRRDALAIGHEPDRAQLAVDGSGADR